jgi:hypothetical protein
MSTDQAGAVVIQVTAADFGRLCENSCARADLSEQPGRFEALGAAVPRSFREWRWAYWLGGSFTAVIFARAFLAARGFDYEILFDTAEHPNGAMYGYVILTDYQEGVQ